MLISISKILHASFRGKLMLCCALLCPNKFKPKNLDTTESKREREKSCRMWHKERIERHSLRGGISIEEI